MPKILKGLLWALRRCVNEQTLNSIIREETPRYFTQLMAIYEEIKYTDSVFRPTQEYISKYKNVQTKIDEIGKSLDGNTKKDIDELRQSEQDLPGAIPSLKRVIIEFLLERENQGIYEVSLDDMYSSIPQRTIEKRMNAKMDTINNSIRGELNKHEEESNHRDGAKLFKRTNRGIYSLTDKGRKYSGR